MGERANVTVEVAMRHIDDAEAPTEARVAAIEALGKLGTTHSREILHRVSRRTDDMGIAARRIVTSRTVGTTLSERELEVLDLARHGLTNRDIGERLSLSPHTVARHVANARAKLGAANRTEAAAKFEIDVAAAAPDGVVESAHAEQGPLEIAGDTFEHEPPLAEPERRHAIPLYQRDGQGVALCAPGLLRVSHRSLLSRWRPRRRDGGSVTFLNGIAEASPLSSPQQSLDHVF